MAEARGQFEEALRLDPNLAQARDRLERVRRGMADSTAGAGQAP